MKPNKRAVSLIIKNDANEFLVVKRPDNPEDDLAGAWGFPAVTLHDDESEVDGVNRIAVSKLGVKIELGNRIGESTHERPNYVLTLCDYEAKVSEGTPSTPQPDNSVTQYSECKYTNDPSILFAAARKGSQCTQIFLEAIGVAWR